MNPAVRRPATGTAGTAGAVGTAGIDGTQGPVGAIGTVGTVGAGAGGAGLSRRAAARLIWVVLAAGLALLALLVARSQVGGDQLNLLARGWLLAVRGRMVWFGNPLSTGGKAPGGVTTLLVGLPLLVWRHHRAATALVALCHLAGYLLLDRTLARILSARERLVFALLYWLSPWQLYFGGFLWNPNYLFLAGAVQLATAWRMRGEARFLPTLLHAATLVLALQVHPSFLVLLAASALLWWRGHLRPHLAAAVLGGLLGALPLLPWAREVLAHPVLLAGVHRGFPGRGVVYSLPRGVLYWLRYSSLSLAGRTSQFDFTETLGAAADRRLTPFFRLLTEILGPATVVLPLAANVQLWRRALRRQAPWRRPAAPPSGRAWLRGYALLTFLAAAAVYAVSPTTLMYWQGLCLFHAAVLPLTLCAGRLLHTRHAPRVLAGAAAYAGLAVLLTLGIALGTPDFRCQGRGTVVFPLRSHSPMFQDLHIQQTCPWPLDRPNTWWPDVLPLGMPGTELALPVTGR